MNIDIGKKYYLTFGSIADTDNATKYGSLNGIYHVERVLSYEDLLTEGVDLYENFHAKAAIERGTYDANIEDYLDDAIYNIVSLIDGSSLWVPQSLILGYPNPNVNEYNKTMVAVELGVFEDPETLVAVETTIRDAIKYVLGTKIDNGDTTQFVDPKVSVVSYETEWMLGTDYDALVEQRKAARAAYQNVNSTVGTHVNLYAKLKQYQKENAELRAQITGLSEALELLNG